MENDNNDLTVYEYSKILYQTFTDYKLKCEKDHQLKSICVDIGLFVTSSNNHIHQYEYDKYHNNLKQHILPFLSELIVSFIMNPSEYLRWTQFKDIKNSDVNLDYLQKQLTYSHENSVIHFSHPRNDVINVRTQLLAPDTTYFINVYCFEKNDELWLGLVSKDYYKTTRIFRRYEHGIFYYGARESTVRWKGDSECNGTGSDCNHGSIQGAQKVIKHPLPSYSGGDWINFKINVANKVFVAYKNGTKQYELTNKLLFPMNDCYFLVEVDYHGDRFYIEQTLDIVPFQE